MSMQQPAVRRKTVSVKTILLLLLVVALGLFCYFNSETVPIVPFGSAPKIVIILLSFALGLCFGWIAKSVFGGHNNLAPDEMHKVSVER